jgi:hypothetical protein
MTAIDAQTMKPTRNGVLVWIVAPLFCATFWHAAFAFASTGTHRCQGDPPIQASLSTSCKFAQNIETAYVFRSRPYLARYWVGWIRSPVTRKWYRITCRRTGPANRILDWVTCTGVKGIWVRFSADV